HAWVWVLAGCILLIPLLVGCITILTIVLSRRPAPALAPQPTAPQGVPLGNPPDWVGRQREEIQRQHEKMFEDMQRQHEKMREDIQRHQEEIRKRHEKHREEMLKRFQ